MPNDKAKHNLTDLIDINLLQKFQDFFAVAMGMACVTVDQSGPITKPSNYNEFCNINMQHNILGDIDCDMHSPKWGKSAVEKGGPLIFKCQTGLTNFVAPIVVNGNHLGSMAGGQIFTDAPNEEIFKEVARKNNIDEEKYIEALRKIKIVPMENVKAAADLLLILANAISQIIQKNLELIEKNKRENLYRNIIEAIGHSLDIDKILQIIAEELVKLFDVERVAISKFEINENRYSIIPLREYLKRTDIKRPSESEGFEKIGEFAARFFLENKKALIVDNIEKGEYPKFFKEFYKSLGVKSLIWFPIISKKQIWGFITLAESDEYKHWTEEDISLLESAADQIFTAIHQAQLYEDAKKNAEKEHLLRDIIETIRSTLDLNEAKKTIVTEIGKALDADRVLIVEFNPETNVPGILDEHSEYLSSSKELSYVGFDFASTDVGILAKIHKKNQSIIVQDVNKYIEENKLRNTPVAKWLLESNLKSGIGTTIYYGKQIYGVMVIHYTKPNIYFSEDQIKFIRTLADQVGIALYQARLYDQEKKTGEREALLRKTVEILRSKLDSEKIKQDFVKIASEYFNSDRCLFVDYDREREKFLQFRIEKLKSPEIKSLVGVDVEKAFPEFADRLRRGKNIIIRDTDKTLSKEKLSDYKSLNSLRESKTMSDYGLVVKYKDQIIGILIIHYVNQKRALTHDEFDFLKILKDQVGIALHQAELYLTTKEQAEKEALLRKTIEFLRSKLDPEEIKNYFVKIIGKYFYADRCLYIDYDKVAKKFLPIKIERLKSNDIPSVIGLDVERELPEFNTKLQQRKSLIIKDLDKFLSREKTSKLKSIQALHEKGVKSDYALLVEHKEQIIGVLVIHFVKEKRVLSREEFDFLRTLRDQVGIALYQAELYQNTKRQAERESLLRNITEAIRGSLDIEETKNEIVTIIGKTLSADRCFIVPYNKKNGEFEIIENEYVSSDKFNRYKGNDINKNVPNFVAALKKGLPIIVKDKEILIDGGSKNYSNEKGTIEHFNVNSAYGFPFFYNNELLGALGIHYIGKKHEINEDEIKFLATIADQIAIAFHQAELYQDLKQAAANQNAILNNMPFMAWLKDRDSKYIEVNNEFAKMCNQKAKDMVGKSDYDFFPTDLAKTYIEEDSLVINEKQTLSLEEPINGSNGTTWHSTFKSPVLDNKGEVIGTVGLSIDITERKEAEFEILRRQKEIIKVNERESLLRKIFETMRSSLDINVIKKTIVEEVGKALKADVCFLLVYNPETDLFSVDEYSEFKSSPELKSFIGVDSSDPKYKWFVDSFKINKEISFENVDEFVQKNNLNGSLEEAFLRDFNIKSAYNVPIFYANNLIGYIIMHYTKDFRKFEEDEGVFVRTIATQAGTAFHQAKLYEITQLQAKREKNNRTIVEILGSTLDKDTIKHLFVQNIGKFFNANRVFFSDYDDRNKTYLPVDKFSEYLSSFEQKSFVGYDWSSEKIKEYIQPLLDKREFIISCWEDYAKEKHANETMIIRFKDANVKSSYNFPVIYQGKILGFFCIEFTGDECKKLSDEEINRLRNICIQAGIALYNAELYLQTQESAKSKENFIKNISAELQTLLGRLMEISMSFSTPEFNEDTRTQFLDILNNNTKNLTDLKNNIISISEIESENFNLHFEMLDTEEIFMDILRPLKHTAEAKKQTMNIELKKITIIADKKRLTQVLYNLVTNIINMTPDNVNITISTELQDNKLIVSMKIFGTGIDFDSQNIIFETYKQIDSKLTMRLKNVGLGLSIAKKLIEIHHGEIHVDSMEDRGTNIWFILPNASM